MGIAIKVRLLHWYKMALIWFDSLLPLRYRVTSLIYPDQNALIGLGLRVQRDKLLRKRLYVRIKNGSLRFVVSTWHLIETAQTTNVNSATRLADFIDTLMPRWIHERRALQKMAVKHDFYRFCNIQSDELHPTTSKAAVIGALFDDGPKAKYDIPARDFVRQWIEHPEQLNVLKKVVENNADTLVKLRTLTAEGKITAELKEQTTKQLFELSLPQTTPNGLQIGNETAAQYVEQANINAVPTLAVEEAISENEWGNDAVGKADKNTFVDKMHLISALPYVDKIVTNDSFFGAIYPAARASGHVKAVLISNEDFMRGI
jgi:hypothetical protein